MRKITFLIAISLIANAAFAGMIMGTLIAPGTPTDTAYVFVFHDFSTLMDTAFFWTTTVPPDYDFVFDDPAIIDDYDYNVMGLIPSGLMPESGDPAGQYPDNPFRISGGLITGVDVELAETGGVDGRITYSGGSDSLKIDFYNQYPVLFGGSPSLDGTWPVTDTGFTLDSIPSGTKTAIAWSDVNGNDMCDTTGFVDEPHAWFSNDMEGIFIVGGGVNMEIDFNLDLGEVAESERQPTDFGIRCFPNPFNSTVSILVASNGKPLEIEIYDALGKLVDRVAEREAFTGFSLLRYNPPENMASGVYLVKATSGKITKTQNIVYTK